MGLGWSATARAAVIAVDESGMVSLALCAHRFRDVFRTRPPPDGSATRDCRTGITSTGRVLVCSPWKPAAVIDTTVS
jgi:hypothetical protein